MKTRKISYFVAILSVLSCLFSIQVQADTLEVGPSGYPYSKIQDAIDAANTGDTVLVHDGTYEENIVITGKSITLRSANGPTVTIIDGNNTGYVVYIGTNGTIVDGFTIRNGTANFGAGIRIWWQASAVIKNSIITGNIAAWFGGGIYTDSLSTTISDCTISFNSAGDGGGVFVNDDAALDIKGSLLQGNHATCNGATFGARGGAIFLGERASANVTKCDVVGNKARNYYLYSDLGFGGGIYSAKNSSIRIKDSFIRMNTAFNHRSSSEGKGGGIYSNGSFSLTNSVVYDNTSGDSVSPGNGGGIYLWWDSPEATIINSTIASNRALSGKGGGLFFHGIVPEVVNSIFWWNSPDTIGHHVTGWGINITYSDIEGGGYPGTGNIDLHPRFEDPDFHLMSGSPCINSGTTSGAPEYDFEGDPRLSSVGGDDLPDMGADEYYIQPLLDLIVESIVTDPLYPKPDEPFSVYVTIKNKGAADVDIMFRCGFNPGYKPFSQWQYWYVYGGLNGGASITKRFDLAGRSTDFYKIQAAADWGNVVEESDEDNNALSVYTLVGSCKFETKLDTANASGWFGGDDRPSVKPRNVGVGQSIMPQWDCWINSVGFKFSGRFDYHQNPSGQGHEVTLVLNLRSDDGAIMETVEKVVPAEFDGGWVLFDLFADLDAGEKYIFTCYLKDGEILEYSTGILGHTEDLLPNSRGYSGQISTIGGDMEVWNIWNIHPWDFNFRISGIYSDMCRGDFDCDGDVDGSDLAVLAANPDVLNLSLFAAEFGRTNSRITATFNSTSGLDGYVTSTGSAVTWSQAVVGDNSVNIAVRGFLSFDISGIPLSANIISATLRAYQEGVNGTPYADLGDVIVDHLNYGSILDGSDYDLAALQSNVGSLSNNAAIEYKTLDVTARVEADINAGRARSQYRLLLPTSTDSDNSEDSAFFTTANCCSGNLPELVITYELPTAP